MKRYDIEFTGVLLHEIAHCHVDTAPETPKVQWENIFNNVDITQSDRVEIRADLFAMNLLRKIAPTGPCRFATFLERQKESLCTNCMLRASVIRSKHACSQ